MKAGPTLSDVLYRASFDRKVGVLGQDFRTALVAARKFVLDEKMSAFLADLGWRAYKAKPRQALVIVDQARRFARLPHPITWIEWQEVPLAARARKEYGSQMDPDMVPISTGYLMLQHPGIDTAFMAISLGIGMQGLGDDGEMLKFAAPTIAAAPFAFTWRTDDGPLPWPEYPGGNAALEARGITIAGMLTGIPAYRGPIGIGESAPYLSHRSLPNVMLRNIMAEQYGMLRYIFALLSTINELPVSTTAIRQSRGFVARGRYRKFLDHTVITLKVPTERYRAIATRALAQLRRRAHLVRGHWRKDWRNPLSPLCEHRFITDEGGEICKLCQGRKSWIAEHQRGDASLGFVTHDYRVEHDEKGELPDV